MKFTDLFIQRPVLALVLSALLLIVGLQSASRLQLREFPEIERGTISVQTAYPGASARTVQGLVTTPLQVAIAGARGIEYLSSSSDPGFSQIQVSIRLGENTSEVLSEVSAKINEVRNELPRQIEDPVVGVTNPGDALMYLSFVSKEMSLAQVTDYLARSVQPELATLDGVGRVQIFDNKFLAMRLWLDPVRMAALGVTAADVLETISRDNYISAAGSTEGNLVRATVDARTDRQTPEQFASMVIRQQGQLRVRLGDVADVELAEENTQSAAFSSGIPSITVAVTEAPDANPLEVSALLHTRLQQIERELPADMELWYDMDGTAAIREGLKEVGITLLEAGLIVMLVIYLFLGSFRVIIIPLVAIPLSLIGVLTVLYALGFSLNLLTLLALVIAIGLVVDDAIVVVENIHRHIENGASPREAALAGARQVALPVIAMTLTLAAVYAPIAFLGGLTGTLFTEFALSLAGAVVISGVVALTLSPMMCSRVLKRHDQQGRFATWLDGVFEHLRLRYQRVLAASLDNRGAVLLFSAALLASLLPLFQLTQQELAPQEDNAGLYVAGSAPQYANLDYINHFLDQVVQIWREIPEVSSSWQISSPGMIFGGINLVHWNERERTQAEIQEEFQQKINGVAGLELFTFSYNSMPGTGNGLPVGFVVASTLGYDEVQRITDELTAAARESGLFAFVTRSLQTTRPEVVVNIDSERAARLGISNRDIGTTLGVMLGEAEVNRFTRDGRSYKVIPQAARGFRLTREELEKYYLRTRSDTLVPLSTVINLETRVEPNSLTQFQQLNSSTISGAMMPPNSLGTGLDFLEQKLLEIAPNGFRAGYIDGSRRFKQESASFPMLFALSLILIFLVLAAQFNSFRDPIVVLVTVPLSIFGAVVPLTLGLTTLNIYTQIGLLTLIGLISKHGILIVEFANQLCASGFDRREAVLESASQRLRPILMTTFATVLGVLPLVLASGAGANSRYSIGLVITTGMLVGTLFTLFVVPVFYLPISDRQQDKSVGDESAGLPTEPLPG